MIDSVMVAVREAAALLLPVSCAGCEREGTPLCDGCRAGLAPVIRRRLLAGGLVVVSALEFDRTPARVIRRFKDGGRPALASALAPAMRPALAEARSRSGAPAWAVPVPATGRGRRRRGFSPVELLLRRSGVAPLRALRWQRSPLDQRTLDRGGRAANLTGSLSLGRPLAGQPVIIVDDIVTTGATIGEARRALLAGGACVVGAVALAATPLHLESA